MAKFLVVKDIAILDRGHGAQNRFTAIDGVTVDDYGSLSPESLWAAKRALSQEAVRQGAVRIHESNCVDMGSGGLEASDDMVVAYNGGDVVYTSLQSGFAIEKFMIMNYMLLPATKFTVPRISIEGRYPAASPHDVLETAEEVVRFLPSPTPHEVRDVIEMILEESRIVYFTPEDEAAVLRALT